jgi:asparagine synthase (glutamine-hydrolysing)
MCGLAGIIGKSFDENKFFSKRMSDRLNHRGPDYQGSFFHKEAGLTFFHNRLSIQDLSKYGNQPMKSNSGRFLMIFNGEIYNHHKLRSLALNKKKITWNGSSDSETLINLFEENGIDNTLPLLEGMFSIAVFDFKNKQLHLIRDRFGQKPLLYYQSNDRIIFASEIKAFEQVTDLDLNLSSSSIDQYRAYGYIFAPSTIYRNLYSLLPSEHIIIDCKNLNNICILQKRKYWKPLLDKTNNETKYNDLLSELDKKFDSSIKQTMLSDLPIGSFLSSGIDSSLVTYYLAKNSTKKINTFSIGYENSIYSELDDANIISKKINTKHHEIILNPKKLIDIIDKLPFIFDQPFSDPSQIASLILSDFAKKSNTVVLTGDGADEIFSGYDRHRYSKNIWDLIKVFPQSLRNFISVSIFKIIRSINKSEFIAEKLKLISTIHKTFRFCDSLKAKSFYHLYQILKIYPYSYHFLNYEDNANLQDFFDLTRLDDLENFLPFNTLYKTDISSMQYSLEARAPFLNQEIVNFGFSLNKNHLIRHIKGKKILRDLIKSKINLDIFNKGKKGFQLPISGWLKNELKDWAINVIKNPRYFSSENKLYELYYEHHCKGITDYSLPLWNFLIIKNWMIQKDVNFNNEIY